MGELSDDELRLRARSQYADENLDIDDHAVVSRSRIGASVAAWVSETGAWVAIWVWVSNEEDDDASGS